MAELRELRVLSPSFISHHREMEPSTTILQFAVMRPPQSSSESTFFYAQAVPRAHMSTL